MGTTSSHPGILILGGGFAGLAAAHHLARAGASVQLLDERPSSIFMPLLPDLISRRVRAEHITFDLKSHLRRLGIRFIQTRVRSIEPPASGVETETGKFKADFLLNCMGCETNYYGNKDMEAHAMGLKSIEEGEAVHAHLQNLVANFKHSSREKPANLLVVGGGYTGFECAAHAAHYLRRELRLPYSQIKRVCRVIVLEQSDTPLRNVSDRVRRWAMNLARSFGIEIITGLTADSFVEKDSVRLTDGTVLKKAFVLWTAGVKPGAANDSMDAPRVSGNRLKVDSFLRVEGHERLFAAGDVAGPMPHGGQPLRMGIQFSLMGGQRAAENILLAAAGKELKAFDPLDLGYLVPLAPGKAAGVVLGREMAGTLPIFMHYAMCVIRSWNWANRLGVALDVMTGGA